MTIRHRHFSPAGILLVIFISSAFLKAQDVRETADFKLALGLYNDGMFDLAVDQFAHFIATYPASTQTTDGKYYLGMAQLRAGRLQDGRASLQNFAISYPEHPKAAESWLSAAQSYEEEKRFGEAATAYARLRSIQPKSRLIPGSLVSAARLFRIAGDLREAEQAVRTLLNEYPGTPEARPGHLLLAEIYESAGNDPPARQELAKALRNSATSAEKVACLLMRGAMELHEALYISAESTFTSVLRLQPPASERAEAETGLAAVFLRKGDAGRSQKILAGALSRKDFPDSLRAPALKTLADAYRRSGNYEGALAQYVLLPASPAGVDRAWRWDAVRTAVAAGNRDRAYAFLQPLLDSAASADDQTLLQSARMLSLIGKPAEAARYFGSFLARSPGHPASGDAMLNLAALYADHLDRTADADAVLRRTAEDFPNSPAGPEALLRLAAACERQNHFTEADQVYRLLLAKFPALECADSLARRLVSLSHRVVSLDAGVLKQLSTLLAELAENRPRPEIYYRLGWFAFDEMKDFETARMYFRKSLDAGLEREEKGNALFALAECLRFDAESRPELVPDAITAYGDILALSPPSSRFDDAVGAKYLLESAGAGPLRLAELAASYQSHYPSSGHAGRFAFDRATAEFASGNTVHALTLLKKLTADTTNPSLRGKAILLYGDQLALRNQVDSAIQFWSRAAELSPVSPVTATALSRLAEAAWNGNRHSRALAFWQHLAGEFGYTSAGTEARKRIPSALSAAGKPAEAVSAAETLLREQESNPLIERPDPGLLPLLGELHERRGDHAAAARCFLNFLSGDRPDSLALRVCLELGSLEKSAGNTEMASAYFREAAAYRTPPATDRRIADLFFDNGQYASAASHYLALAHAADSSALRREYLGAAVIAQYRNGAIPQADQTAGSGKDLLAEDRTLTGKIRYERGLALYRKEQYTEAQKCFREVLNDFGGKPVAAWSEYYLGKIAEARNKPEDAVSRYEHILSTSPSADVVPRVHLALGNMHFNAERYDQAIVFFRNIVSDSAGAGDVLSYALNNLIEAYEAVKQYDAAIAAARTFIQKYPEDESIVDKNIKLGTLYTKVGYFDQAVEQFRRILADAGSAVEAEIFYDIGDAYYTKGDYEKAIPEFLKVPYAAPGQGSVDWTATALYMAGQSYEKLSRLSEALQMYQQIVDRPGIDATYKTAARKEITRIRTQFNGQ